MAKIIGKAGEFQGDQLRKRLAIFVVALVLAGPIFGYVMGLMSVRHNLLWSLALVVVVIPVSWCVYRMADRQLKQADIERRALRGEIKVGAWLEDLPDTFTVVNDLDFADSYGNIDHVVIGPTGVFAIDAKNWRGTVSADGKGELLLNGKPLDKPQVKRFTRRVMDLKDRIKALTRLEPYIQLVFVFPIAFVEAKWGSTGSVNCMTLENLVEYITTQKGSPLSRDDVATIARSMEMLGAAVKKEPAKA